MTAHDPRLAAFRPDLADARLRGQVEAARFVEGRPARIGASVADIRSAPRPDAGLNTQALPGDEVSIFELAEGWAWIQSDRDGYVGYVADTVLADRDAPPTHIVAVPRTFSYPGPDMKWPRSGELSLGSRLTVTGAVETRGTRYALLASGEAVVEAHLSPLGEWARDHVAVAETLVHTPYLWGGTSGFGIDCSGLVQLSMMMSGRNVLRDTDMQAATIGSPIEPGSDLSDIERGDLVFWKGHVAIMADNANVIHANGHTMNVAREPLTAAIDRIRRLYGEPTGFRRP